MDKSSHGGIETAIAELDATINYLSRQPETDKAATAAMISATTARAVLRDMLPSRPVSLFAPFMFRAIRLERLIKGGHIAEVDHV